MVVASYLPKNINSIPIDKLIKFRDKYSAERVAYFDTISELSQNVQTIDNESALEDALNHYSKSLIDHTTQLKLAFEGNKIETVCKFVSISAPTSLVSMSSIMPVEYKPLGLSAGLLFGLASSLNTIRTKRNELRKEPLSYLLSMNSELSGDGILRRIDDGISGMRKW